MRLLKAKATNFASYAEIEFDYTNLGLSLVYGPTGSGKSTLCDLGCWILYSKTAKDGNADEVRSWQSPNEPTQGEIDIELPSGNIKVYRTRGKSSQNDLYWTEEGSSNAIRGKDLTETQKLLESRIGVSADLYIAGGYYSEFSPTGAFFVSKAKERRALFEKIASLDFPARLSEGVTERRRGVKSELDKAERKYDKFQSLQLYRAKSIEDLESASSAFDREISTKRKRLQQRCEIFDQEKAQEIKDLGLKIYKLAETLVPHKRIESAIENAKTEKCKECGGMGEAHLKHLQDLNKKARENSVGLNQLKNLQLNLNRAKAKENVYQEQLNSLSGENPYEKQIKDLTKTIVVEEVVAETLKLEVDRLQAELVALEQLNYLTFDLRAAILQKAVSAIEQDTNRRLEKYFDAELRVQFEMTNSDDLDIVVYKSGYECVYRQLSKGQRQILRLCFVTAIMQEISTRSGVHFSQLFLDELTDGMDNDFKIKAYALLEELALTHESVLVIDHAQDFQSMFPNKYKVTLVSDRSEIERE